MKKVHLTPWLEPSNRSLYKVTKSSVNLQYTIVKENALISQMFAQCSQAKEVITEHLPKYYLEKQNICLLQ